MRRKSFLAAILAITLFAPSCLGPNKNFNALHEWNEDVTDSRWVNEGIFVVLVIIPAYQITYLFDIVISNSIEWWSSKSD